MSPLNPPTEVECHIEYMIGTIAPQEERYMSYMVSPIARVEDPPTPLLRVRQYIKYAYTHMRTVVCHLILT